MKLLMLMLVSLLLFYNSSYAQHSRITDIFPNNSGIIKQKTGNHYTIGANTFVDKSFKLNTQSGTQGYIHEVYVAPFVVKEGNTFTLSVRLNSNDIKSVYLSNDNGGIFYDGNSMAKIQFFDDGTHGDETAGDSIFSIDKLSLPNEYNWIHKNNFLGDATILLDPGSDPFILIKKDGSQIEEYSPNSLSVINFSSKYPLEAPPLVKITDSLYASENVVNLIVKDPPPPLHEISGEDYVKTFYKYFKDEYDYLMVDYSLLPYLDSGGGAAGFVGAKYDTYGIGNTGAFFDITSLFGSQGYLKGEIDLYELVVHRFIDLNHELLHDWALIIKEMESSNYPGHWGGIERNSCGFGGFGVYNGVFSKIQKVQGNTYRLYAGGDEFETGKYNDIELYLAGLLSIDSVAFPIKGLSNITNYRQETPGIDTVYLAEADSEYSITKADLLNMLGPRIPDVSSSQKNFKCCLIVPFYRKLTADEFAFLQLLMKSYEGNHFDHPIIEGDNGLTYYEATRGKGSISTEVDLKSYVKPLTAPSIINPVEGDTIDLPVTFKWSPAGDWGINYRFKLWNDNGSNIIDTLMYDTEAAVTGLQKNKKYYWSVTAINIYDSLTVSSFFYSPKPVLLPPDAPTLISPADNISGISLKPKLEWDSSYSADSYRVQISENSAFSSTVFDSSNISINNISPNDLMNATEYFWRVNAKNSAGISHWSDTWKFTTVNPSIILLDSAIVFGDVAVQDSEKVPVRIVLNNSSSLIIDSLKHSSTLFHPSITMPDTIINKDTVKLEVEFKPLSYGDYTDTLYVYNNTAASLIKIPLLGGSPFPDIVTNSLSIDFGIVQNATTAEQSVKFYNNSVNSLTIDSVYFQTAHFSTANVNFPTVVEKNDTLNVTLIFSPDSSGMYSDTLFVSNNSSIPLYKLFLKGEKTSVNGLSAVNSEIPNNFELAQNYPNPFNPITYIKYGIPKTSYVRISVYNLLGQEVSTLVDGIKSPGYFEVIWNPIKFSSGIYLYSIFSRTLDGSKDFYNVKKMVLLK